MAVAVGEPGAWQMCIEPVGPVETLLRRLAARDGDQPVVLGVDFPIGVPRAFAMRHLRAFPNFPAFLWTLRSHATFLNVAETLDQVGPERPFYPNRGVRGMTRLSHALALGLESTSALSRACDAATTLRPAGAPVFWTLGANQSGKAAISAWRDLLIPGLVAGAIRLWPFEGALHALVEPGRTVIAETYPADALRQIGLRPIGSKRRQVDRLALVPGLREAMQRLGAAASSDLEQWLQDGFGADAAGEDRLDCVLGVLCVMLVLAGRRPDAPPPDPWLTQWEGWVLGQA